MNIEDIRLESRNTFLARRAIERYVWSDEFALAFDRAPPAAKLEATRLVREGNIKRLRDWSRKQLGEEPISYWRSRAKLNGVPNWFKLSKEELIEAVRRNEETPSQDGTVTP